MPATYDPYEQEDRISPVATRDVYGRPIEPLFPPGIQDAPPYGFIERQPIQDAPPYGFIPTPDGEDYYTLSNRAFSGDRFAPGSETSVAFDAPSSGGVRYPIALPQTGGQVGSLGDITPDFQRALDEMSARNAKLNQVHYTPQNQMELDRAIRNQVDDSKPESTQDAMRLQGLLEFQALTRGGMDSAEAIRKVAPKLYFNSPQATALATRDIPRRQIGPPQIVQNPDGSKFVSTASGGYQYIAAPKALPVRKEELPLDVKKAIGNADAAVNLAQKALSFNQTTPKLNTTNRPPAVATAQAALDRAVAAQSNIVKQAMQPRSITPPPAEDVIPSGLTATNPKTGEKIILRNGQWVPLKK